MNPDGQALSCWFKTSNTLRARYDYEVHRTILSCVLTGYGQKCQLKP